MDQDLTGAVRSLPAFALAPTLAAALLLLAWLCVRTQSVAGRFVFAAVWLRCALAAMHEISFSSSPLGLSYNALASVAISGIGLLLVRRRRLTDVALLPFYPLLLIMLASGLSNHQVPVMATALTKYAYLIVLVLAAQDALEDLGAERFFRGFLVPFALPFTLQIESVLLGVAKAGEKDGSASYIGGFYHEAAFSVTLAAAILGICMLRRVRLLPQTILIAVGLAAILLANYRTAILGVLPLVAITLLTRIPGRFVPEQRALIRGAFAITAAAVLTIGAVAEADRFGDLATVVQDGASLIKRPDMFNNDDRNLLSGRPKIWSGYIYAWVDAAPKQKMIGFGPESWAQAFKLYAHNTIISSLYETGVLGVIAMLFLWSWMIALAFFAQGGPRVELLAAHFSFLVLNMATMPMWMIEGMICYGTLCGYTVYSFKRRTRSGTQRLVSRPAQHIAPAASLT